MIVLLIIFMVITPMLQKGVDVKLPLAGNTKERKDEPKTITVAIKKDATTYLGATKFENQNDLVAQLKERLEDAPAPGTTVAAAVSIIRERGWALVGQEPIDGGVLDVW